MKLQQNQKSIPIWVKAGAVLGGVTIVVLTILVLSGVFKSEDSKAAPPPSILDVVLGTNNVSISEVQLEYNGSTITQTQGESGVSVSTSQEVLLKQLTIDTDDGDVVLDFFNSEGVTIRNNNFASNVQGVGVYNGGNTTSASNQAAWEPEMIEVVNNNNILSYMYYDASSNLPSGDDFDVNWTKGLTDVDYMVVQERDGNTYFTLTPLGKDGNPISAANALRFGFSNGANSGNGSAKYDWNTGFAPGNYTSQPMMLTVVDVELFNSPETIFGIRIDNNGDADVKFYGLSIQSFEDNPGNPLYTNDVEGVVWLDADSDEMIDGSETKRASNVKVYLYDDENGNGVIDNAEGTPIDSMMTNDDGFYRFSPLYNGGTENYIVSTNPDYLDFVYDYTTDNIETASFSSAGNTDSDNDFGYDYNPNFVFMAGTVWNDINENESLESSEPDRAANVIVNLYEDANGNGTLDAQEQDAIASTITDEFGEYTFAQYYGGAISYIIQTEENSLAAANSLTTDNIETASFTSGGTIDENNDFGYATNSSAVGISGRVWFDENKDEIRISDETTYKSGVTVNLYSDQNNNGVLDAGETAPVETTTTNSNGYYKFDRAFSGTSSTTYGNNVEFAGGITNASNALGDPSTTFAEFYDNSDNFILELDATVATGDDYTVYLSNRNGGSNADVIISESTDGINYTYAHTISVNSTSKTGYTVQANQSTKYIKFDKGNINSISGYNTSGSASGSANDYNIYGIETTGSVESYIVDIDESDLGATHVLTTDNLEVASFTQGGQVDGGNDFGYAVDPQKVLIEGTVWEDRDADENIDQIEDGRASNITVNLYVDENGNQVIDASENTIVATTTTNSQGYYSFERSFSVNQVSAVEYQSGIVDANETIGEAGSTFAQFYENSDNLILELDQSVSQSDVYSIFLANKTAGSDAEVIISESSDGVNFTYNTTINVTSENKGEYEVTAAQGTKFIKIDKGSINSISGYNVSGSASGSVNDFKVFGARAGSEADNYIMTITESTFPSPGSTNLTTDNFEYATFTQSGTDSHNDFGYQNTNALPVDLVSFRVSWQGSDALLRWTTANELNNDYFDVQWSEDGTNFESIGKVDGMGTTLEEQQYSFVHSEPRARNFYRLQQFDFNGDNEYSSIITLTGSQAESLKVGVSPNPFSSQLRVQIESPSQLDGRIIIRTMSGKEVYNREVNLFEGNQAIEVPEAARLEPGTYILIFSSGDKIETLRIVKSA